MGEQRGGSPIEMGMGKNRDAIVRLAQSGEAKALISMLQKQGSVQEAAKKAAAGDAGKLMEMMTRLMSTKEGAQLVEQIQNQAKRSGIQ